MQGGRNAQSMRFAVRLTSGIHGGAAIGVEAPGIALPQVPALPIGCDDDRLFQVKTILEWEADIYAEFRSQF